MVYVISQDGTMIARDDCVVVDLNDTEAEAMLNLSDSERFDFANQLGEPA